ncbi:MAG: cell wall-binding repeat-containing protein [Miniphocaeibacter sp.]|uniref:cell wall-binding repeat-containing protein n=1 Tax=Miniphocaeibacter sp. TaxID=3100973 RepID=UPI003BB1C111
MLRTKRITSFLLAFVMVFSIFVGTVSKADETKETVKASLVSLKVDGKDIGEAITQNVLNKYGLKLKSEETGELYDFNSEDKKLVSRETYTIISGSKYEIKSVVADEYLPLKEEDDFKIIAIGANHNFVIELTTKPTAEFKATIEKPEGIEDDIKAEIYEKGKTTPFVEDFKLGVETKLTKGIDYELKFKNVPAGYAIHEKDKEEALSFYEFKLEENLEVNFELKKKPETDKIKRLAGDDRYETAVEIAQKAYPTSENLIVANGQVSADALAAGPLANALEAPILLVRDNSAIQGVRDYIRDNGVNKIYVVGGVNSVSENLVTELKAVKEGVTTGRIYGKDRYETSIEVALNLKDRGYTNGVIIANGTNEKDVDALAASTYATENKMPIVLTNGNVLTSEVKAGLKAIGITKATIIGGPQTVAEKVINGTDLTFTSERRISGSDRFETSVAIAEKLTQANVKTVVVANAYKSPDALTAGPLAYAKNAAIILSKADELTSSQKTYIGGIKNIETAYITGGINSVNDAVETTLQTLVENSRDK